MTPVQLRNVTEASPKIRVAIVCGSETTALADSAEALLAEAKELTFSRFEYHSKSGFKPDAANFGNPDVVVATLDAFQETFAYPEGQRRAFNTSSPGSNGGLSQRKWTLDLSFHYQSVPEPEEMANYALRLAQPLALAWRDESPLMAIGQETLYFGRELDLGIIPSRAALSAVCFQPN